MSYAGTTAPLVGAATYTSPDLMANTEDFIVGTVVADQIGTLTVEQGYPNVVTNAVAWEVLATYTLVASTPQKIKEDLVAPKWRLKFVNGATPQTVFRLNARATSSGNS